MRTFDADALMLHMDASKYIRNNSAYTHGWNDALEYYINYIAEQSTIEAVPVVRCKDCEYGKEETDSYTFNYFCRYDGCAWNNGDHFCSYGERRKDATD